MSERTEPVDALVAEGRSHDAIEVLTRANRARRDADIEARLVELRRDATIPSSRVGRRRPWPPRVRDRFRRTVGIPEVTSDRLTPKVLRSAILKRGCLLVRGLVSQTRVDQLVADIDEAFAAYDAHVRGTPVSATAPWFVPFEGPNHERVPREWVRDGGGVVAVDSPRALFDVIEAFDEVGVRDLVTTYFGEPPLLLANKWTLRRVSPGEHRSLDQGPVNSGPDWHQDGAFMGGDIRSLDLWLSLSHCGVDAPGLDVVAQRIPHIVETGTDGSNFDWSVGHGMVERVAQGTIVRPVFAPGDALLFDHLLLHRTALDRHMTQNRYAIEAWFAAPSSYPANQIPIAY